MNLLIRKMSTATIALVICCILLPQKVYARVDCTTPPDCYVSGTTGFVGTGFANVFTNDPQFDTARFTSTTGYDLWVTSDVRMTVPYKLLEKMYFDGDSANNPQRMDVKFSSSIIDGGSFVQDSGESRTLETSQLNLNHVNFSSDPALQFFGTDNQINLIDSRVEFSAEPLFISNAPLTINVKDPSGANTESSFVNFSGNFRPASTTINLENRNTLTIEDSGRLFTSTDAERLYFGSPVTGNVNNATLKIDSSNVYFNSTSFDFTNGGTLELVNPDSKIEFRNVSFNNSLMTLGNNTTVTARNIDLDTAYIDLGSGAKINADVTVRGAGTTILGGSGGNFSFINAESFVIDAGATFQQDSSRVTVSRNLLLEPGATLKVNSDDSVFLASTIIGIPRGAGGTVDVNTGGTFSLGRGLSNIGRNIQFDIDATSFLQVGKDGLLDLGFLPGDISAGEISVQNEGQIDLDGTLAGDGSIAGSGRFLINESGQINPGNDIGYKIGTITFENEVEFTSFGASSNRSRYLAEIDVVGGNPSNDLLQYDDQGFDITNLSSIEVNTVSANTATQLDGKQFTIVASVDSSSTGALVTGGNDPVIIEGSDIPALVDFTITNESTNGNDDITLNAAMQNPIVITHHPSVVSKHRPVTSSTSVPHPTNPNQTVTTTVQVTPTSNGGATQTTTVTTTDQTGAIISSSTGTTQLGTALGSNNRSGSANLLTNAVNNGDTHIINALGTITNAQVGSQFDSLHAEPYSSHMTVGLEQCDLFLNMLLDNAMGVSSKLSAFRLMENNRRLWVDAAHTNANVDGKDNLGSFDYRLSNLIIGADLVKESDSQFGLSIGFGHQSMDEHDIVSQDFKANSYHFGAYGVKQMSSWQLRFAAGYGYGDNDTERNVNLGSSLTGVNKANFDSHTMYMGIKGVYKPIIETNWIEVSPDLNMLYSYYYQEKFEENGVDTLCLQVDSADAQSIITGIGVNAAFKPFSKELKIYPVSFIRYERDWFASMDDAHEVNAALKNYPTYKQTFTGQNRGADILTLGIGIESLIDSQWQVGGGLIKGWDSNGSEFSFGVNVQYNF